MEYQIVLHTNEVFLFDSEPIHDFHKGVVEVVEVLEIHNLEVEMVHLGNMQIGIEAKST